MKAVSDADAGTQSSILFQAISNSGDPDVCLAAAKKLFGKNDLEAVSEFVKQYQWHEQTRFTGGVQTQIVQRQVLKQLALNMAQALDLSVPKEEAVLSRDSKVPVPKPTEWDQSVVRKATEWIEAQTKLDQKRTNEPTHGIGGAHLLGR